MGKNKGEKTLREKHVRKNMREKTCGKKHGRKNIARKNMRKTCVLAVRDDELSVGDDETRRRRLPRGWTRAGFLGDHMVGLGPVM